MTTELRSSVGDAPASVLAGDEAVLGGITRMNSLSPSRAADFMSCPLLYRFRTIDKLEEAPSPAAVRGTLVHSVLERLFDVPASQRTLGAAVTMLRPTWDEVLVREPELASMFAEDGAG